MADWYDERDDVTRKEYVTFSSFRSYWRYSGPLVTNVCLEFGNLPLLHWHSLCPYSREALRTLAKCRLNDAARFYFGRAGTTPACSGFVMPLQYTH